MRDGTERTCMPCQSRKSLASVVCPTGEPARLQRSPSPMATQMALVKVNGTKKLKLMNLGKRLVWKIRLMGVGGRYEKGRGVARMHDTHV